MDLKDRHEFLLEINAYYSSRLAQYGATPRGVDWNGEVSQRLRFEQLVKLISTNDTFSINDLGCGYGAFFDFLNVKFKSFSYSGIDVAENMIGAAERSHRG